jgi:hypothetical protein
MTQTTKFCKWGALFLAIFLAGCPSHLNMSEASQASIATQIKGQSLWLKQSLYGGPFYDDDRFRLAHARKFEELTYLRTPDGDIILPPPSDEIIGVGTRVKIEKIEWPTGMNIFKRPIFTPRHCPWLYLRVARDRGQVTMNRDHLYILLVPDQVHDDKSFREWLEGILSSQDTNNWLMNLDKNERDGVLKKQALVGMSSESLMAALGQPDQLRRESVRQGERNITKEVAIFGPTIVILEDEKVVRIEQSKK